MKNKVAIFFFLLINVAFSQTRDSLSAEQAIEEYLNSVAQEGVSPQTLDYLEDLAQNKLNLNTAGFIELARIPFLDYNSASAIIEYRNRRGKFHSLNELYDLGIPVSVVRKIKPFLRLKERENEKNGSYKINGNIRARTIAHYATLNEINLNIAKTYSRLILSDNNGFSFNAVLERDALEKNWSDFKTANLSFKSNGVLSEAILGGYVLQFGQGLTIWSPYSFSKTSDIKSSVTKNGKVLLPYKSTDENFFLNGVSAKLRFGAVSVLAFYSDKKYDAVFDSSGFISIPESGIHVSDAELRNRNSLRGKIYGGILSYGNKRLQASFLAMKNIFSADYYNKYVEKNFGREINYFSGELKFGFKNLLFASEIAYNGFAFARFLSAQLKAARALYFTIAYRNYPPEYFSFWARGFGEYSKTNNEKGIFFGGTFYAPLGKFSAYYDIFSTIPYSDNVLFDTGGNDLMLDFVSARFLNSTAGIRVKFEQKGNYEEVENSETKQLVTRKTLRLRGSFVTEISRFLRIKTQVDFTRFTSADFLSEGYSVSETVRFKKENYSLAFSFSFFDTDDYYSRIYIYEYDLDGVFRNDLRYGKGLRFYLLAKAEIFPNLSLSLKYAETFRFEKKYYDTPQNLPARTISLQVEYSIK